MRRVAAFPFGARTASSGARAETPRRRRLPPERRAERLLAATAATRMDELVAVAPHVAVAGVPPPLMRHEARTPGPRSTGERAGFILLHAPPASAAAAPPWPARLERPWHRRSLREREMRGKGEKMTRVRPVGTFVRAPSRAGRPIRSSGSQRRGAPARAFGH